MSDHIDRIKNIIEKQHAKECAPKRSRSKRNQKPEQITVRECMDWFNDLGFSMSVVESKAVFSASAGRYLSGQTVAGFTDSAGCTPYGMGCFVEFKARGKRSTLRPAQREFIKAKIFKGCFACVVDSKDRLHEVYFKWLELSRKDKETAIAYLLSDLPKKKEEPTDLFDL